MLSYWPQTLEGSVSENDTLEGRIMENRTWQVVATWRTMANGRVANRKGYSLKDSKLVTWHTLGTWEVFDK